MSAAELAAGSETQPSWFAARWRPLAVLGCVAACCWIAWYTQDGQQWFTRAVVLPVPALIAVGIAPTWRIGVPVVGALLVAASGLVLLSTQRPDSLRPPQGDWFVPYLVLAVLAWAVGFAARARRAGPDARGTLLMIGGGVAVLLVCIGIIASGGSGRALPFSGHHQWVDELPRGEGLLRQNLARDCYDVVEDLLDCRQVSEYWTRDGRPATQIADQLAAELRALGWPVKAQVAGFYVACLPMRGVFTWDDSVCIEVAAAKDASLQPVDPSGSNSVVVSVE
jgi:hypothetical protein